jgi:hypothetical protein
MERINPSIGDTTVDAWILCFRHSRSIDPYNCPSTSKKITRGATIRGRSPGRVEARLAWPDCDPLRKVPTIHTQRGLLQDLSNVRRLVHLLVSRKRASHGRAEPFGLHTKTSIGRARVGVPCATRGCTELEANLQPYQSELQCEVPPDRSHHFRTLWPFPLELTPGQRERVSSRSTSTSTVQAELQPLHMRKRVWDHLSESVVSTTSFPPVKATLPWLHLRSEGCCEMPRI